MDSFDLTIVNVTGEISLNGRDGGRTVVSGPKSSSRRLLGRLVSHSRLRTIPGSPSWNEVRMSNVYALYQSRLRISPSNGVMLG